MIDPLVKKILDFFATYQLEGPFLLGYSGGVDSKALLYLLLEVQKKKPFSLEVAHVDHGLRKSSKEEAQKIAKELKELNLPLHQTRLSLSSTKNLEEQCRDLRQQFYQEICKKRSLSTLFLAHQADDVAETTLKRVFEGAKISKLYGMSPVLQRKGYRIARPLLEVWKKDLRKWLAIKDLQPIEDPTNWGEGNLRAKMRSQIFPDLEGSFGKKVKKNVYELSKRALELSDYLEEKTEKLFRSMHIGPWGVCVHCQKVHPFELYHFLHRFFAREGLNVSHQELSLLRDWIVAKKAYKFLPKDSSVIWVDRGYLFLQKKPFFQGAWEVMHREPVEAEKGKFCPWIDLWKGEAWAILPKASLRYRQVLSKDQFRGKTVKKHWEEQKAPLLLAPISFVVTLKQKIYGEFLSRQVENFSENTSFEKVIFSYRDMAKKRE